MRDGPVSLNHTLDDLLSRRRRLLDALEHLQPRSIELEPLRLLQRREEPLDALRGPQLEPAPTGWTMRIYFRESRYIELRHMLDPLAGSTIGVDIYEGVERDVSTRFEERFRVHVSHGGVYVEPLQPMHELERRRLEKIIHRALRGLYTLWPDPTEEDVEG